MTAMPSATGLFEAHLGVADLSRATTFYADVLGLPLALRVPERGAAFFWIGDPGESMLGLWSSGHGPMATTSHIALRAPLADVLAACDALRSAGVTPLSFFGEPTDEPSVIGWMPAAAVYLRDPDGHLIEYLAMLDEPPRPDAGIVPWSQWEPAERWKIVVHTGDRNELRRLFEEAEDSPSALDAYLHTGDVLVAVQGDRVLGHLQLIADGDASEVKNMAVRDDQRGRGIGRALLEAAADIARRRPSRTLDVATAAADIGNLRFYQRGGFRLRGVERDAFTPATGYAAGTEIDGIALRDRVWLDRDLVDDARPAA
jgi:GNAT superfamily N-acetyltransferase